jgi:hypothetical protein
MSLVTRARSSGASSEAAAIRSPIGGFVGGALRAARGVIEEQVVGGDVEDFGQAEDHVGRWRDPAVLVSADLGGVAASRLERRPSQGPDQRTKTIDSRHSSRWPSADPR